jgi:hypothetical protein
MALIVLDGVDPIAFLQIVLSHPQHCRMISYQLLFAISGLRLDAGIREQNFHRLNRPLMKIVDQINRRFPKAISVAATGFDKSWKPKADRISPRYTTDWRELVYVK